MSRRLRLAESDLKNKEQRHALKVELLEKRLGRLTSTLTAVQQETRRSADEQPLALSLLQGNLADQPEEFRQFLELVTERERDLRRAELQVSGLQKLSATLERQLVDLALGKFDAERAVTQARSEEEYWSNKAKGQGDLLKSQAEAQAAASAAAYSSFNQGLFENLFRHTGGQFESAALNGEPSAASVMSTSNGLPSAPAFCAGGLPPFGMFVPPFGGLMPPSEEPQSHA
jgi:regulator of protease activity HflC (stomatin/prohibitin superfamily)